MGELEAVGDAVTASVLARAVEPEAGEADDGHTHEVACLNCAAPLTGPYCNACGQHAHVHRTLGAFFHDLLHGVFHFEGKIWRTLPLLAWRPGELSRRYIDGQRASFISPIALFLFCMFVMFGVISASGLANPQLGTERNLALAQKNTEAELAKLQKKRAEAEAFERQEVEEDIKSTNDDLALIRSLRAEGLAEATYSRKKPEVTGDAGWLWLNEVWQKAKANPDLVVYKLKSNSYKWSWTIIPLSVPFLWLMFPFSRRFHIYDHVVFVTYSLCFMSLLVALAVGLGALGLAAVSGFLLFVPPIHMYRQLKGTYGLSWFGALWRTVGLTGVAVSVLITFTILMVALGVLD
jgi:hypothetical protein